MSDDYLWDRSGTPDPDVLYLERMLPRVREQVRRAPPAELSPPAPGARRPGIAAAALAAGLLVALGAWQLGRGQAAPAAIRGEPPAAPVAAASPSSSARTPEPVQPARAPAPTAPRLAPPAPIARAVPPVASVEPEPELEASTRSAAEIQAVVARHRNEVKERCWEPALAKRKEGAAPSVKLAVTFTIEASGRVSAVKAGASPPDYPGLASCVAGEVGGWSFGPAEAALVVAVPFVFAEG